MQSVVAMLGWPEFVGILMVLLIMLNAERISRMFNGLKHGMHEFMLATRAAQDEFDEAWKIGDDRDESHRQKLIDWLTIVLLVTVTCAMALVLE